MKTNNEFIKGIYEKYNEHLQEKQNTKKRMITRIVNVAAIVIVALSLIIISNGKQVKLETIEDDIVEEKINLPKVGNFENFYNIIQENSKNYDFRVENSLNQELEKENDSLPSKNYSSTNVQVDNVDEADIVKVDNKYIYYIIENKIVIINANKPQEADVIAEISYDNFSPKEMYINKNKLIVIGWQYGYNSIRKTEESLINDVIKLEQKLSIIIYNLDNIAEPKEIRKIEIEGSYLSSRMIENNIYIVSNKYINSGDILNKEIQNLDEKDYQPKYLDTANGGEEKCIGFDKIYSFEQMENTSYLIITGINLENTEEPDIKVFLGAGEHVYSSSQNMYIAINNRKYDDNYKFIDAKTHIIKFELKNGKINFKVETDVDGNINNQFSMDEDGEFFRIATTIGDLWNIDENTSNNLYVLDSELKEVGKVSNFAKEEKIYSVRYVGNKAYIVTFKQTDPLFVVDLSDPTEPIILGELKIPGYSTYLHPYDETHIIGFGYDTKENGTRIVDYGLKMVMFDISNLSEPKELFKVYLGDRSTSSELTYNHKALLYLKEKNILAFPMTSYKNGNIDSKAVIYQINLQQGFIKQGEISTVGKYDYKKQIERIVFINDAYYALSNSVVKLVDVNTMEMIKEIEL